MRSLQTLLLHVCLSGVMGTAGVPGTADAAAAAGVAGAAEVSSRCPRPAPGAMVAQPTDLRSVDGLLRVQLAVRDERAADGTLRFCYVTPDGTLSPTLRLHPGDTLQLELRNELSDFGAVTAGEPPAPHHHAPPAAGATEDPCRSGRMSLLSTNLHFHGLSVPPLCHQDEVLKTSLQPGQAPFEYRFRIPDDEPPGLYWYHPHIHGFSTRQVLGGASGALIIEGLERANPAVAGLPERVLVIRDQDLLHPTAPPSAAEPVVPKLFIDRDGDAANNGTGFGRPAKDLSLNYVPVPYPDYPPARLEMAPQQRELWRVLNASAITYLNLALLFGRTAQPLGVIGIDGVPLERGGTAAQGQPTPDHLGLPPGARAEFIVTGPPAGVPALLVTRSVDTGQGGENDPNRALAAVIANAAAPQPPHLPQAHEPLPPATRPWLGEVTPVRVRRLYFSEKLLNPADPNSATEFYLTVDGQPPRAFDPAAAAPNIEVRQGEVEDWIIENRSTELHAFHIHQIHFLLLEWSGVSVHEGFLRDTVNVPYYNGRMLEYPRVRLRMDFRDPNAIGTFVYHCHLLEHEDGGMMGTIRVEASRNDHLAATPRP